MKTLTNQAIQLIGGFLLALIIIVFIGILSIFEMEIPDVLDRTLYVVIGSFLGVGAVNGVRRVNGK